MVEHLQRGEVQEAQVLLDATGCTCPTGKLWHSIFDERGDQYSIHDGRRNFDWIVFEPQGLVEAAPESTPGVGLDGQEEEPFTDKGKGKRRAEETFSVKCRLSTTGQDHIMQMSKDEKIGSLMKRLSRITGVSVALRSPMFTTSQQLGICSLHKALKYSGKGTFATAAFASTCH